MKHKLKWAVIRHEQLSTRRERWEFDTEEEAQAFADELIMKRGGWMYTDVTCFLAD